MKFEEALGYLLAEEGGFVNNPRDPGGVTDYEGPELAPVGGRC